MSGFSRVEFNPRVDGTVQRFAVTSIGPERREGASAREDVVVDAQVHTPTGPVQERTIVFTLERPSDDGRWTIVGLR